MRSKQERRQYYRGLQGSFTAEQYKIWNEGLADPLREVLSGVAKGALVAAYQAKTKEAHLDPVFSLSFRFCFPRVTSTQNAEMEFREVTHPLNLKQFEVGAYGILEPSKQNVVCQKESIQACLVPLLAFDSSGRRLGQGKGFYDRFLQGFKGLKIGVGFEWQFSPQDLPADENDQSLDLVVTEHQIRRFER